MFTQTRADNSGGNLVVISSGRVAVIFLLLTLIAPLTLAGDPTFKRVVKHLETHYRAKKTRIPFLGLAGLAVRIIRPAGLKSFKLAVFEDQDFSAMRNDPQFDVLMRGAMRKQWQPMVSIHSRRSNERVFLYSKPSGKDIEVLIVAVESNEAVALQAKMSINSLVKWMNKHGSGDGEMASGVFGKIWNRKRDREETSDEESSAARNQSEDKASLPEASVQPEAMAESSVNESENNTAEAERKTEGKSVNGSAESAVSTVRESEPKIEADLKVETRLVNLNTKVLNSSGRAIVDLGREDFTIYEDGVKQELSHFASVTAPIDLTLLLDFSGSTDKKRKVMKKAAENFIDSLGANDRVTVAAFTRRYHAPLVFSGDKKQLKKAIGKLDPAGSGTAFYDAVWKAMDQFQQVATGRRAMVVLTDGVDNTIGEPHEYSTKHDFAELLERIGESDLTIYPMYLDTEYEMVVEKRREKAETYTTAKKQLTQMAEQSGGQMFRVNHIDDLNGVYQRVAEELRTLYSLAYASTNDRSGRHWRKVSVSVARAEAMARTRSGYFAK
jgi:Ca-activated chloride channel family protein